jgi:hypothetical protein
MTKDEFEDAKTLWKMIYAYHCFRNVENACSFILDQNMDENHPAYYSLITGIYVLYGKPFKHSNVVGKLSDDIQIVRPCASMADTQPQLQPALLRLSAMISQYFIGTAAVY